MPSLSRLSKFGNLSYTTGFLLIIDNLRHCCSHTACHCARTVNNRTFVIIRRGLPPLSREQSGLSGRARNILPWTRRIRWQCFDCFFILGKQPFQLRRHFPGAERTFVGITENISGSVIAGDNHESGIVVGIEYIVRLRGERLGTCRSNTYGTTRRFAGHRSVVKKIRGDILCFSGTDLAGARRHCHQCGNNRNDNVTHIEEIKGLFIVLGKPYPSADTTQRLNPNTVYSAKVQ